MNTPCNPMQPLLVILWNRLNRLNGFNHLVDHQLRSVGSLLERVIEEWNEKKGIDLSDKLGLGTSLAITDLTGLTDEGWLCHYPTGVFNAFGEDYFGQGDDLLKRQFAWSIAQGYESFETYLKDVAATWLCEYPSKADANKVTCFNARLPKKNQPLTGFDYWRALLDGEYRGKRNAQVFRLLRELAPAIASGEKQNNHHLDLVEWYQAVTSVRDSATHCSFVVGRGIDDSHLLQKKPYSDFFPCIIESGTVRLNMDLKNAERGLGLFAEYAFLIFKCLSQSEGYEWHLTDTGWNVKGGGSDA